MKLNGLQRNRLGGHILLVLAAASGALPAFGSATSLALRAEPQGTSLLNPSQAVETVFGSNLTGLPFSHTTNYHFYSPPMSEAVALTTSAKGGGVIFMKNTATSGANDFSVLGRMQYFDYDPATGADSLIVDTTDSTQKNVNHGQTVNWAIPNQNLPAAKTLAKGHLLHIALTLTLVSGNPGAFGQLLYNGPSGSSTVALFPQNISMTWTVQSVLSISKQANRTMLLSCSGTPAEVYTIQAATNLASGNWTTLGITTADATGFCSYIDTDSTNYPCRFYRVTTSY
jgi:hypothetical protein